MSEVSAKDRSVAIYGDNNAPVFTGDIHGNVTIYHKIRKEAPHQLSAPLSDFVGREEEIKKLIFAIQLEGKSASITGIRGMGGIGKTELAYVVAHQVRDQFPDAQIVLKLQGTSPNPITAIQALQLVIQSFEAEPDLTDDLNKLRNRYCTLLANKRVLILADDADNVEQIRSLRPPDGCALLITSRHRFTMEGMSVIDLDVLPHAEAERLLLNIHPYIAHHAGHIAELCGYLPLALRICASILQNDDSLSVQNFAQQLQTERLKYLHDPDAPITDPYSCMEASISLSYTLLDPIIQSEFCKLGVFPDSFDLSAAQAILEEDEDEISHQLSNLLRRGLVECNQETKRYRLHELIRAYAMKMLGDDSHIKLLYATYYLKVLTSAYHLYTSENVGPLKALTLFEQERSHIDTAWLWLRQQPLDVDIDILLVYYAFTTRFLNRYFYNRQIDRVPQLESALAASQRLQSKEYESIYLFDLGSAYTYDIATANNAIEFFQQALKRFSELRESHELQVLKDPKVWMGDTLVKLGETHEKISEHRRAIGYFEQGLDVFHALGEYDNELRILEKISEIYYSIEELQNSQKYLEMAHATAIATGNIATQKRLSWSLGFLLQKQGDLDNAIKLMGAYVNHLQQINHPHLKKYSAYLQNVYLERYKQRPRNLLTQMEEKNLIYSHFPGMPMLTYNVKRQLESCLPDSKLYLQKDEGRKQQDVVGAYKVYVDEHNVGRFTIRKNGSLIERNFLCILPASTPVPPGAIQTGTFGCGSAFFEDRIRILIESIQVFLLEFAHSRTSGHRAEITILKSQTEVPPLFPSDKWKISLQEAFLQGTQVRLTLKICDIEGKEFALPSSTINPIIPSSSVSTTELVIDIGGYCAICDKYICQDHIELTETSGPPDKLDFMSYFSLTCRICGGRIFSDKKDVPESYLKITRIAKAIADAANNNVDDNIE